MLLIGDVIDADARLAQRIGDSCAITMMAKSMRNANSTGHHAVCYFSIQFYAASGRQHTHCCSVFNGPDRRIIGVHHSRATHLATGAEFAKLMHPGIVGTDVATSDQAQWIGVIANRYLWCKCGDGFGEYCWRQVNFSIICKQPLRHAWLHRPQIYAMA